MNPYFDRVNKAFAENFAEAMSDQGLVVEDIALSTEIPADRLRRLASGEEAPSWADAVFISWALFISLEDLASGIKS